MWLTGTKSCMAWSWKPGWGEMGMKKQQTHTEKQDKTGCTAYSDGDTTMKPRNSGIDYVQHKERSQLVSVAGLWKSSLNFLLSRKLVCTIYTLTWANDIHCSIILEPKDGFVISIDLMRSCYWYGCALLTIHIHSGFIHAPQTEMKECQLDFQYNPQVGISGYRHSSATPRQKASWKWFQATSPSCLHSANTDWASIMIGTIKLEARALCSL